MVAIFNTAPANVLKIGVRLEGIPLANIGRFTPSM